MKLIPNKAIIKTHVVSYKHATFCHFENLCRDFVKARCVGNHFIGNARNLGEIGINDALGINQGGKGLYRAESVVTNNTNFRHTSSAELKLSPTGLNINDGKHAAKVTRLKAAPEKML